MIHSLQIPCFDIVWKSITVLHEALCPCCPETNESHRQRHVIVVLSLLILLIPLLVSEVVSSFESLRLGFCMHSLFPHMSSVLSFVIS